MAEVFGNFEFGEVFPQEIVETQIFGELIRGLAEGADWAVAAWGFEQDHLQAAVAEYGENGGLKKFQQELEENLRWLAIENSGERPELVQRYVIPKSFGMREVGREGLKREITDWEFDRQLTEIRRVLTENPKAQVMTVSKHGPLCGAYVLEHQLAQDGSGDIEATAVWLALDDKEIDEFAERLKERGNVILEGEVIKEVKDTVLGVQEFLEEIKGVLREKVFDERIAEYMRDLEGFVGAEVVLMEVDEYVAMRQMERIKLVPVEVIAGLRNAVGLFETYDPLMKTAGSLLPASESQHVSAEILNGWRQERVEEELIVEVSRGGVLGGLGLERETRNDSAEAKNRINLERIKTFSRGVGVVGTKISEAGGTSILASMIVKEKREGREKVGVGRVESIGEGGEEVGVEKVVRYSEGDDDGGGEDDNNGGGQGRSQKLGEALAAPEEIVWLSEGEPVEEVVIFESLPVVQGVEDSKQFNYSSPMKTAGSLLPASKAQLRSQRFWSAVGGHQARIASENFSLENIVKPENLVVREVISKGLRVLENEKEVEKEDEWGVDLGTNLVLPQGLLTARMANRMADRAMKMFKKMHWGFVCYVAVCSFIEQLSEYIFDLEKIVERPVLLPNIEIKEKTAFKEMVKKSKTVLIPRIDLGLKTKLNFRVGPRVIKADEYKQKQSGVYVPENFERNFYARTPLFLTV